MIGKAKREKRFRPRAVRIDSTVVEADVRYPTDSGLALDSARVLAREARKLLAKVGRRAGHVQDRSRAIGRRVRAMTRTLGREVALDGGFQVGPTHQTLERFEPERTFIAGRQQPGSRRTQRRLARYRTGSEGRISHLKRGYGLRRTRLKDHHGMQTWTDGRSSPTTLTRFAIRTN